MADVMESIVRVSMSVVKCTQRIEVEEITAMKIFIMTNFANPNHLVLYL